MNDETTDIQDMSDAERKELAEQAGANGNMLTDRQAFAQAYQVARLFASSQLVPQHLQGKTNDCFIALHMANRLREDPLMVCQNIVIVHGTAGWKATWLIGRANRSGVFRGRIRFTPEGSGDSLSVTASAVLADTGEEVKATVGMQMAKAEGWTKNAKYQSMPEQMLSYRAASFLIRLYCPEATLGYQTAEELQDMEASGEIKNVTPPRAGGGAAEALRSIPGDDAGQDEDGAASKKKAAAKKKASSKKKATAARESAQEPTSPQGGGSPGSDESEAQAPAGATQAGDDGFGLEPPGEQAPSGGGPSDAEIVQRIQRTLPAARSNGDLDTIADLESEAGEIVNEDWREHCRSELQAARQAVETGQT